MGLHLRLRWIGLSILVLVGSVSAQELPKDALLLIDENIKVIAEIRKNAEAQTQATNDEFRTKLEKLQTAYTKEGKLDEAVAIRNYLRAVANGHQKAIKGELDPGVLTSYRSEVGRVLYFEVTGSDSGTVYGTDIYTHDSRLSAAAVHAGVLKIGEKGIVKVTILPGQNGFKASGRNGVSSSAWSNTDYECYKVESPTAVDRPATAKTELPADVRPDPGILSGYRNQAGKSQLFEVTGSTSHWVYGNDIYTDDSNLSSAAVHAGVLADGKQGIVKVTFMGPQSEFSSSTRNGVRSYVWGSWAGSYKVEAVKDPPSKLDGVKEAVKKVEGVKEALNALEAVKGALK